LAELLDISSLSEINRANFAVFGVSAIIETVQIQSRAVDGREGVVFALAFIGVAAGSQDVDGDE
jgi:hypothetical protein